MKRAFVVSLVLLFAGCATQQLSQKEIAKLTGGTTTVVVFGFCVPMDHIIQTAMTRSTLTYVVNGKKVGSMKTCSHATFRVPSGYWPSKFVPSGLQFPYTLPAMAFKPGKTQYLHMRPAGYGTYSPHWVSQAEAQRGIAEIKKIGQIF